MGYAVRTMNLLRIRKLIIIGCAVAIMARAVSAEIATLPAEIRFDDQVRPLFSEFCFACHGPDPASRKADLRLDARQSALDRGAIVPGSAGDSELIARIISDDPDFMMPPPGAPQRLSAEQQQLLASWIDAGAPWQEHWSFVRPGKPEVPRPERVDDWALNQIDHFVLDRLNELGLAPNDQAEHHVLARRAALDLTGLPPDEELLQVLLADADPLAWSRYVDSLLASKHAGEHRARYWLDAARYGDTHGMHVDNYREIWPYRDWVINAFNRNMPFDQFVIEQLAGDLLPDASLDQQIATGFNRCNITTSEGGAIPDELDVRYMVDRVETTATVFLGLTAGCAVCHDHKYDPITQREFYQLGAFFNNTVQPAMDGNQKDSPPVASLPAEEFQDEWDEMHTRRDVLRTELNDWSSQVAEWWASHPRSIDHPVAADDLLLWLPLAEEQDGEFQLPEAASWATDHPAGRRGVRFGEGAELTLDLPTLRSDEPLTISFWYRTPDRVVNTTLLRQKSTRDDKSLGWEVMGRTRGDIIFDLEVGGKKIQGVFPDNEGLPPRSWHHVCIRYSGGQSKSSVSILADGQAVALRNSSEAYVEASELSDSPLQIASDLPTGGLSDVRIFRRWLIEEEVELLSQEHVLRQQLASGGGWTELRLEVRDLLTKFYDHALDQDYRSRSRQLAATQTRRDYIYARSTTTLVMRERLSPAQAWVLKRGDYTQRGEQVGPGVPSFLPPLPQEAPTNRETLARWLVHPDHPLTARVMVNRLWQSVFGVGLVKTAEDFGVMGDRPSHPELLDWLATEFVDSGWDMQHVLKLILTSATYRQRNNITSEKLRIDPDNRYFSRGPRVRLDAEVLRDQALAVSGLLRRDLGGPSVKPYQPAGVWKVVAFGGSNTREFQPDSGDALYRRSVYTFWKRTSPPPSMAAFNAPTREQCTVRRERTNTPLQALVMMNDTQFVEAARHLAQRVLRALPGDRERAAGMLSSALIRPATEVEVTEMTSAAAEFRAMFQQDAAAVEQLIHTGESEPDAGLDTADLAAWTMVAHTMLNSDECINK